MDWWMIWYAMGLLVGGYIFYGVGYDKGFKDCQRRDKNMIDETVDELKKILNRRVK